MPADHVVTMQRQSQLVVGGPRDRQDVITAHELAVNELRDHGYPYAKVATDETEGPGSREVTIVFTADPGTLAHFGDVEIAGNNSVSDGVIRRQLTFNPGDLYRRSVVQDAQRRLYCDASCFSSSTWSRSTRSSRAPRWRRVSPWPREASARELRHRLRHRGEGARRRGIPPRELLRRRSFRGRPRAVVVARSRCAPRCHAAVFLQPAHVARRRRTALVHLHAGVQVGGHRRQGDHDAP